MWEQVGYLADDADRLAAYELLEEKVGTTADAILAAPLAALRAVTRHGGAIAANERADRLRLIAERLVGEWDGDLNRVLELPFADARRELTKYPSIGEAGADVSRREAGGRSRARADGRRAAVRLSIIASRRTNALSPFRAEVSRVSATRRLSAGQRSHPISATMTTNPSCPKCNTPMDDGFIVDDTQGGDVQSQWTEGKQQHSFRLGVRVPRQAPHAVTTYRCPSCGYLGSYAPLA